MTDNPSQRATEVEAVARAIFERRLTPRARYSQMADAHQEPYRLDAQAAITALDAHRAGGVGKGCCSVGLGGPYVIPPSGLEPGCKHPWHISFLPKGYAPTSDDFIICLVAEPPGEDWGKFGLTRGDRPPLVKAICAAIEGILRAARASTPDGGGAT